MMLDPADNAGIRQLAEQLAGTRPCISRSLRGLENLPVALREEALAAIRLAFDQAPVEISHPFLELPASLRSEFLAHHRSLVREIEAMVLAAEA